MRTRVWAGVEEGRVWEWRKVRPAGVAEDREGLDEVPFQERHLRCVWFDPAYRPMDLTTVDGEPVIVDQPGRWNLEAGPDFLDARLRIGTPGRCLNGDVELHIHPEDWIRHEHGADSRYRRVVAHVTYYERRVDPACLPPGTVQIALRGPLRKCPSFSFETLDLTAYPYALRTVRAPCAERLAGWPAERVTGFLETAGLERLSQKTARMRQVIGLQGADQALYEETLAALGYKSNRRPFRLLAQRISRRLLAEESQGDSDRAYALLCGVAGLLPTAIRSEWDEETRRYVRRIWDYWWKFQARHSALILPREAWCLSGLRPANHPVRRLAVAALMFGSPGGPDDEWSAVFKKPVGHWAENLMGGWERMAVGSYWSTRYGFGGQRAVAPVALLGPDRQAAWIVNILVPWAMAAGRWIPAEDAELRDLPVEEANTLVKQAAVNLLGADHNPAIYRSSLCRQGLIQIFSDFCLNQAADCGGCAMRRELEKG
jgi:hypothetical protein